MSKSLTRTAERRHRMQTLIHKPMRPRRHYHYMFCDWLRVEDHTFSDIARMYDFTPQHARNIIYSELGRLGIGVPVRYTTHTFGPRIDYRPIKKLALQKLTELKRLKLKGENTNVR